jgi:hypothetical protein
MLVTARNIADGAVKRFIVLLPIIDGFRVFRWRWFLWCCEAWTDLEAGMFISPILGIKRTLLLFDRSG